MIEKKKCLLVNVFDNKIMNNFKKITIAFFLISHWSYGQNCLNNNSDAPCCNCIIRTDPRPQHTSNTERSAFKNHLSFSRNKTKMN
jgi:hypothetical protein